MSVFDYGIAFFIIVNLMAVGIGGRIEPAGVAELMFAMAMKGFFDRS